MSVLRKELPDHIYWLTDVVEALAKPAAFMMVDKTITYEMGMTKLHGVPDVPSDATWLNKYSANNWNSSPYDGESFWGQINLETIPNEVRKPEWPTTGLVWIFIDLSDGWTSRVEYDSRPVSTIPLINLEKQLYPCPYKWVISHTFPYCTENLLPEIASVKWMVEDYEHWMSNYPAPPSNVQLGGWISRLQEDYEEGNKGFVCAFEDQSFGDCGAIYLYYTEEKGFYAVLETA